MEDFINELIADCAYQLLIAKTEDEALEWRAQLELYIDIQDKLEG